MRINPMDEWCSNCDHTGHSEPQCPYIECDECEGSGKYLDMFDFEHDCIECSGRGYYSK